MIKDKKLEYAYLITKKTDYKKILNNNLISRLYMGDQECDYNFLAIINSNYFFEILNNKDKKITILLPRLTDKSLKIFINFLLDNSILLNKLNKLEFTINDYFILNEIKKIIHNCTFIVGVYINNQVRNAQTSNKSYIKGDYSNYQDFYTKCNVTALDLFNTKNEIIINNLKFEVNIFYPFLIHGFSRYCYVNHIENKKESLSVVEYCSGCKGKSFILKGKSGNKVLYYKNNKYMTKNFGLKNFSNSKLDISRIIYNYDLL